MHRRKRKEPVRQPKFITDDLCDQPACTYQFEQKIGTSETAVTGWEMNFHVTKKQKRLPMFLKTSEVFETKFKSQNLKPKSRRLSKFLLLTFNF